MKNWSFVFLLSVFSSLQFLSAQTLIKKVEGTVTDGVAPLQNVNISIKETGTGTRTDTEGRYQIRVDEGQTLVYSYVGKNPVEIIVEDVTRFLNVELYDKIEELDGVTVTKSKRKSQQELLAEYDSNKSLVKTVFGIIDQERSGFRIRLIDGEDLSKSGRDFVDGLQNMIPGMQVFRPGALRPGGGSRNRQAGTPTDLTIPVVYLPRALRSLNVVPAIFDVDGVIYTDAPTFINIYNIERIAVLESLGAVARYGSIGAGGVIIINTKLGNRGRREPGTSKPFDQAKLRNNFIAPGEVATSTNPPEYLAELVNTDNSKIARETFESMEQRYSASPYFYLDAFSFFTKELQDKNMSDMIKEKIMDKYALDPTILKALAFMMEASGDYRNATKTYKEVFLLRPHYVQSYLDLANSYRQQGNVEYAATLFARHNNLIKESYFKRSEVFTPILDRDFDNLLALNGAIIGRNHTTVKLGQDDFQGTRLVFEWNDGEAEFELQFVNPDNQYYVWKHTLQDNAERIQDEKSNGYSCEEHLIYEPQDGIWSVNVRYFGNKSLTPTYLKVTTYHNFNTENQKRSIKVFRLGEKNKNQKLLSLSNTDLLSTN